MSLTRSHEASPVVITPLPSSPPIPAVTTPHLWAFAVTPELYSPIQSVQLSWSTLCIFTPLILTNDHKWTPRRHCLHVPLQFMITTVFVSDMQFK